MNLKEFAKKHETEVATINNMEKFLRVPSKDVKDMAAKIVVQKKYNWEILVLYIKSFFDKIDYKDYGGPPGERGCLNCVYGEMPCDKGPCNDCTYATPGCGKNRWVLE